MTKTLEDYTKDELIEIIKGLKRRKKFGLVWEDNLEEIVKLCETELPVLEEVSKLAITKEKDQPTNVIIEGDNYHALSVLNYTHAGKVDVIYIDPPYNTGARDWKYNNHYVDSNDNYRHSKWLSFMEHRLILARSLLKPSGVLIIAIDDNEVHHLRLLLEELMPAYDIASVTIVQNPRGNITNNFARTHEYALFIIPKGVKAIGRTKKENVTPRKMRRWGHNSTREARPTMFYPIYVKDGVVVRVGKTPSVDFHPNSRNIQLKNGETEVWPIDQNNVERRWNFGLDKVVKEFDRIVPIEKNGIVDLFLSQEDTTTKTVWTDSEFEAGRNGATLVRTITGVDFPFPKSIYTVKRCLEIIIENKPDAVVVDFFAGSGTTGHAVLAINDEDNGSRKFVLCTNNEGKIAEEVTYPRIKNVINGYADTIGISANVRYFKTRLVSKQKTDDQTRIELVARSTEMICLREDTFEKVIETKLFKVFSNSKHYSAIVFEPDAIILLKDALVKLKDDKPIHIYVFSLSNDTYESDFIDLGRKHELCPIPESILEVYRRIFIDQNRSVGGEV
jgi:adenine-specific DNA-methyltransferase